MTADKNVRMANQIADFFRSQPEAEAIAGIADHIRSYWNPVMRKQIFVHLEAGGEGLSDLARKALHQLQKKDHIV